MDKLAARAEADRLVAAFAEAGADLVDTPVLLPADTLLDLYGEDIRARAYVTDDPVRGEMMLRPDFTVPIAETHMAGDQGPARYAYRGEVFRMQEAQSPRPTEYLQAGIEIYGTAAPEADAELFALFARLLAPLALRPVTGDIGILAAAIDAVETTPERKRALRRHIWRPRRFRALLDRFSGRAEAPGTRRALFEALGATPLSDLVGGAGAVTGLRGLTEIEARVLSLRADADTAPIPEVQAGVLNAILELKADLPEALEALRDIAVDLPAMTPAIERLAARCAALAAHGVAVDRVRFEATYGRTTLEYYDGFVFGFLAPGRPGLPPVATGGRYDALTRILGRGAGVAAVGGVIRPDLVLAMGAE